MADRESIIRKLNSLRDMANHPATEPHLVEVAMRKFDKLMQEYNLTLTDLDIKKAGINGEGRKAKGGNTKETRSPMGWTVLSIAELTETKLLAPGMNEWVFVGIPSDVQYATWLYDLISNAMDQGALAYKMSPDYHKRINMGGKGVDIIHAFKHGFRVAVCKSLSNMIAENKSAGKGLILLKNELIEAFIGDKGAKASKGKALAIKDGLQEVAHMGHEEGQKVKLRQATENQVKGYLQ